MEINAIYKVPSIYDVSRKHQLLIKITMNFGCTNLQEDEFEEMQI